MNICSGPGAMPRGRLHAKTNIPTNPIVGDEHSYRDSDSIGAEGLEKEDWGGAGPSQGRGLSKAETWQTWEGKRQLAGREAIRPKTRGGRG